MLERLPVGNPICHKIEKTDEGHRIVPGEFELVRNKSIEEADDTTLNTLNLQNYNIAYLECSVDCDREFLRKCSQFKQVGQQKEGTYYFVGLYHDIPVFVDVALNPEMMVIYRELK